MFSIAGLCTLQDWRVQASLRWLHGRPRCEAYRMGNHRRWSGLLGMWNRPYYMISQSNLRLWLALDQARVIRALSFCYTEVEDVDTDSVFVRGADHCELVEHELGGERFVPNCARQRWMWNWELCSGRFAFEQGSAPFRQFHVRSVVTLVL